MRSRWEDQDGFGRIVGPGDSTPLRVGMLCSHRAPGLSFLLDRDPNRGRAYDVICCLTSADAFEDEAVASSHGIPVLVHPIRDFCRSQGWRLSDRAGRSAYDAETVERLAPYRLDLVVLASYLYVLTDPMLTFFRNRIINVHHGDLTRFDASGRARLTGLRAVRDALLAGETETRSTVHLVTTEPDQGPPFLRSRSFPIAPLVAAARRWDAADVLKAYAYAHQEWMIRSTWGPLMAAAIDLVARGRLDLSALARVERAALGEPWGLDETGVLCGQGPLCRNEARVVARAS